MKTSAFVRAAGMSLFLVSHFGIASGPLIPPGLPSETVRPLAEIEPRIPINSEDLPMTISAPGQHYLTGCSEGGGWTAIIVAASGVTLDLGGWTLANFNTAIRVDAYSPGFRVIVWFEGATASITDTSGSGIARTFHRRQQLCLRWLYLFGQSGDEFIWVAEIRQTVFATATRPLLISA